ncbi:MAG TPA: hypothetical protein VNW29_06905 [Candidatus Sulfotelmatobacter sp.]|jgi:hypothetical protein|nr:hypothetical protein [Candidatus Sulfotelmatobacter sp.]
MENLFKSDNILLCSFLLTNNIRLIDVIEDYPRHFLFVLSDADKCILLEKDFVNNAPAPAQSLFTKREMLISQIKNKNQKGDKYENKHY